MLVLYIRCQNIKGGKPNTLSTESRARELTSTESTGDGMVSEFIKIENSNILKEKDDAAEGKHNLMVNLMTATGTGIRLKNQV